MCPIKFSFRKSNKKVLIPTPANKEIVSTSSNSNMSKPKTKRGGRRANKFGRKIRQTRLQIEPTISVPKEPSIASMQQPYPQSCSKNTSDASDELTSTLPNENQIEPIPGPSRVLSEVTLLNESPKEASVGSEIKQASIKKPYILIESNSPDLVSVQVKCPYNSCIVSKNGFEIMLHLKICEFRPVICNDSIKTICKNESVDVSEYGKHLNAQHDVQYHYINLDTRLVMVFSTITFNSGKVWAKSILVLENKKFLVNKEIHGDTLYIWISFLGSEAEAVVETEVKNLCYRILLYRSDNDFTFYVWNSRVYSHRFKLEEIIAKGDCANVNVSNLKSFCFPSNSNDDPRLSFRVGFEIFKIEKENSEPNAKEIV